MLEYLLDHDFLQRHDINELKSQAQSTSVQLAAVNHTEIDLRSQITHMESRIGELNLLCTSLVRLLVQSGVVLPKDLAQSIREVDEDDGKPDGQHHPGRPNVPTWCPKCEARIPPGRTSCMFCGKNFNPGQLEKEIIPVPPRSTAPANCADCGSKNPSDARSCVFCGIDFLSR